MKRKNTAFDAIGPSFEELTEDAMMEIDGATATVSFFISGCVVGYAVTCTVDRIFNPKPHPQP